MGLTYDEVEWGIRLAEKNGGTRKENFDLVLKKLPGLEERSKHVLRRLGTMEEISRHKENPAMPICPIRSTGL